MDRADRALRWARAGMLAAVAALVGSVAHVSAGGLLPQPAVLVVLVPALVVVLQPLVARRASTVRVVALTVAGQSVIHAVLSITAGHRGDRAPDQGAAHGGTAPSPTTSVLPVDPQGRRVGSLADHAGVDPGLGGGGLSVPDPVQLLVGEITGPHAPMMLAHLAASVLVGLWLAHGERSLWRLLCLAWRAVAPPTPSPVLAPPRPPSLYRRSPRPTPRSDLATVVVRRGPPSLLAA